MAYSSPHVGHLQWPKFFWPRSRKSCFIPVGAAACALALEEPSLIGISDLARLGSPPGSPPLVDGASSSLDPSFTPSVDIPPPLPPPTRLLRLYVATGRRGQPPSCQSAPPPFVDGSSTSGSALSATPLGSASSAGIPAAGFRTTLVAIAGALKNAFIDLCPAAGAMVPRGLTLRILNSPGLLDERCANHP